MQETVPARVVYVDWTMPLLAVGGVLFLLLVAAVVVALVAGRRNSNKAQ